MKYGLLEGIFDPPHKGHSKLIEIAMEELDLDKVWIIPNPKPLKGRGEPKTSYKHRCAMAELEFARIPGVAFPREVMSALEELSETNMASILEAAQRTILPDDELWVLLGEDEYKEIHRWEDKDTLTKKFRFAVVPWSTSTDSPETTRVNPFSSFTTPQAPAIFLSPTHTHWSSTMVRELLGDEWQENSLIAAAAFADVLSNPVVRYIEDNMLYICADSLVNLALVQVKETSQVTIEGCAVQVGDDE